VLCKVRELGDLDALDRTARAVWRMSSTEEQVNELTEERVLFKHVLRLTLGK
jgi:hypothetical protein